MKCPDCGGRALCKDSRQRKDGERMRRYECKCGQRFSTLERVVQVGHVGIGRPGLPRRKSITDIAKERERQAIRAEVSAELKGALASLLGVQP